MDVKFDKSPEYVAERLGVLFSQIYTRRYGVKVTVKFRKKDEYKDEPEEKIPEGEVKEWIV